MKLKKMSKEELEALSYKDITCLLLEENQKMNTADIFRNIVNLLELPESVFQNKIGDFYTSLTTDKRFLLLEDGSWDLRCHHTSDKIVKASEDDDEEIEESKDDEEKDEIEEDNYDSGDEEDDYDETEDDLKDLVVIDEDELELEE